VAARRPAAAVGVAAPGAVGVPAAPRLAARPPAAAVGVAAPGAVGVPAAPHQASRPPAAAVGVAASTAGGVTAPHPTGDRPAAVVAGGASAGSVAPPVATKAAEVAATTMPSTPAARTMTDGGAAQGAASDNSTTPTPLAGAEPTTPAEQVEAFMRGDTVDPPLGARLSLAEHARSRARSRAARNDKHPALHRLSRFVSAVKGVWRVDDATLEATAGIVAAATSIQTRNPNLMVMVHMSGVDPAGSIAWASIYGTGRAVDSDVLRVMSQVHQFIRGRDSLRGIALPVGGDPARIVDDESTMHGELPDGMSVKDYLEIMTSVMDDDLPPPLSVQRMARHMSRTAAGMSDDGPNSESDSSGGEDWGKLAFTHASLEPPAPYQPAENAISFLRTLMVANTTTALLVRLTLWAAVSHLTGRVQTLPRYITECTARWWPHKVTTGAVPNDGLPGERWPVAVLVYRRLLSVTTRSRDGDAVGNKIVTLCGIPANKATCSQDEAVAAMLLLWDKEPTVRTTMRHCRFRADVVQLGQDNLAAEEAAATAAAAAASLCGGAASDAAAVPAATESSAPIAPRPPAGASAASAALSDVTASLTARAASRAAAAAATTAPRATRGRCKRAAAKTAQAGAAKRTRRAPVACGSGAAV